MLDTSPRRLSGSSVNQDASSCTISSAIGEDKEGSGEVKSGTPVSESKRRGESNIPSLRGKKRASPEDLKAEASKQGKKSLSGGPVLGSNIAEQHIQGDQPLAQT